MFKLSLKTFHSELGAVSVEYAILAVLIAVVVVGTVTALGIRVVGLFEPLIGAF